MCAQYQEETNIIFSIFLISELCGIMDHIKTYNIFRVHNTLLQ